MAWTPEATAKMLATRAANKAKREALNPPPTADEKAVEKAAAIRAEMAAIKADMYRYIEDHGGYSKGMRAYERDHPYPERNNEWRTR